MSRQIGNEIEQRACAYLQRQGLKLVCQNFYSRMGEIDLIMYDNNYLVFIEVRGRKNLDYGGALSSITPSKQRKIMKTAEYFLYKHKLYGQHPLRFDVVLTQGSCMEFDWIKNAFGLSA